MSVPRENEWILYRKSFFLLNDNSTSTFRTKALDYVDEKNLSHS